jgi:hypothetical protein
MTKQILRLLVLGFMVSGLACATTGASAHSDAEMELAQQHAEDAALARLASSSNHDIADAAGTLARERATR